MTRRTGKLDGLALVLRPEWVEWRLWRQWTRDGDVDARARLFDSYARWARTVALALGHGRARTADMGDDLVQAAYQGLLEAIDRFDPDRGHSFKAFARRRIEGSIHDARARGNEVGAQSRYIAREARIAALTGEDAGRPHEAGSALDRLAALAAQLAISLLLEAEGRRRRNDLRGEAHNGFDSLAWKQMLIRLENAVTTLPSSEQMVVRQHYENGVAFTGIATLMGLSKGRISQLHRSAINRLRKGLGP